MTRLAEIRATNRNLQLRRAHSKQDNIWDQQYPAGERDSRSNLKEYPSREEAVSAWRRGAVRAQNMAKRVGMHPFDEDVQIDDEHGGGGGGGGDGGGGGGGDGAGGGEGDGAGGGGGDGGAGGDEGGEGGGGNGGSGGSGAGDTGSGELSQDQNGEESCGKETVSSDWFYHPFKSLKYKELFAGMISEKEMELQEEQFIAAQRESGGGSTETEENNEAESSDVIFAESQHVVSSALNEDVNSDDPDDPVTHRYKHKSDILIPSLKIRRSKSSIVRSLIKHGKLSANRLIHVTQATTACESENVSRDSFVRNLEDRKTSGLFDNVAVESLDTSTKGYQLAKIIRMRRLFGNRKVEYIKPIRTDGDKGKTIELIVQMYNQHYSQIDKFELTTVTPKINLKDIITLVSLKEDADLWVLSLADTQFLENYFQGVTLPTTSSNSMDDNGRRVQLTLSSSGRLRRAITYTS